MALCVLLKWEKRLRPLKLTPPTKRNLSVFRFTQNLSVFRREVNDSMKNSTYGVNSNDMMS